MSHNEILQNSPSLQSLKRNQLVQLCKKHELKANGKNTDLIQRLKRHGSELPPEDLDYCWENPDEDTNDFRSPMSPFTPSQLPRPSEQWEMIMDDIAEVEENGKSAMNALNSLKTPVPAGEFGAAGSKSASKFSLKKAITNSLGLKRSAEGEKNNTTAKVDSLDPAHTGPFDFPNSPGVEPIPGTSAKPGTPAPANARLSTGTRPGLTTTIRLISSATAVDIPTPPRIAPFHTTFDLNMSPDAGAKRPVWPASPLGTGSVRKSGRLYPTISSEDIMPSPFKSNFDTPGRPSVRISEATPAKSPFPMPSDTVDDVFSPAKPVASAKPTEKKEHRLSMPNNQPYLFGSPIAQPNFSSGKFDAAAATVLEEMNKRLAEAGVQKVEKTVLGSIDKAKVGVVATGHHQKNEGAGSGAARFAKAHEEVFNKMDPITNHYAARRPPPASSATDEKTGQKRKSVAAGLGHGPAPSVQRKISVAEKRVDSTCGRKKMSVPGGFGDADNEHTEEGAQEDPGDARSSKRVRINENEDIHKGKRVSRLSTEKTAEELKKQERAREATRRHLDAARRRSIQGKASLGIKAAAVSPKKARFGILGAAKALVRGVWGMGAGSKEFAQNSTAVADKARPAKPPVPSTTGKGRISPTETQNARSGVTRSTAASSARARSPIPAFHPPQPTTLAPRSTSGTHVKPRTASLTTNRAKGPIGPGTNGSSSLGVRRNVSGPSKASSLAKPTRPETVQVHSPDAEQPDVSPRKRTLSTLLQPTASSLAKQAPRTGEPSSRILSPSSLRNATSPNAPVSKLVPPKTSIFTKPVTTKTFSSPIRSTGDQNMTSLGAAAETILEEAAGLKPSTIVHKPRVTSTRVIGKPNLPRVPVDAAGPSNIPRPKHARVRSSMGATPKKEIGVMKNERMSVGGEALRMKVRQSEYARRKSKIGGIGQVGAVMDVDA
ncbi:hypothetical protein BDY19DRAFT_1047874 [Irpex rosettiformis]|uniref:Uncharacterized protein n=1 Tax=Irpex rosettiformis TaxID=378272 RepID=A0ACB8U644_9APHY|nr:hypothetical protein BDY19DRAFT_1047874 [Irpex rosettiformis]